MLVLVGVCALAQGMHMGCEVSRFHATHVTGRPEAWARAEARARRFPAKGTGCDGSKPNKAQAHGKSNTLTHKLAPLHRKCKINSKAKKDLSRIEARVTCRHCSSRGGFCFVLRGVEGGDVRRLRMHLTNRGSEA